MTKTQPSKNDKKGKQVEVKTEPAPKAKINIPVVKLQKDKKIEDVEGDVVFVVTSNGLWLKRKLIFGTFAVPITDTNNSILFGNLLDMNGDVLKAFRKSWELKKAEPNAYIVYNFPPIPFEDFKRVEKFFADVYEEHAAEAMVLLYMNPDTWEMIIVPPENQIVSSASIDYKFPKPKDVNKQYPGFKLVGSIHSHANFGAGQSGTDSKDEHIHFDGIHITIGDVAKKKKSYHSRLCIGENQFSVDLSDIVDVPADPDVEYDEIWMKTVTKRTYTGSGYQGKEISGVGHEAWPVVELLNDPTLADFYERVYGNPNQEQIEKQVSSSRLCTGTLTDADFTKNEIGIARSLVSADLEAMAFDILDTLLDAFAQSESDDKGNKSIILDYDDAFMSVCIDGKLLSIQTTGPFTNLIPEQSMKFEPTKDKNDVTEMLAFSHIVSTLETMNELMDVIPF